ncbi:hypothetical protein [Stenotrophomonas sp. RG-453]|uniref:hypothetical protein n=1 Tax=Stenotrophomonas sp. RG-453 TaxID=2957502 RepID=UPI0029C9CB66|nr:hypothetical protein [Stenotrophomonas sp. RG-453]MDX5515080.1 hypothetical protein [Stenotrophomonas sp. RG-453]
MNQTTTVIPSVMRLAFEASVKGDVTAARKSGNYQRVKSGLNRRLGVSYRKRMWSVERAGK